MVQNPGDKGAAGGRKLLFPVRVKEDVLSFVEQGHVGVHAGPGLAEDGLGHEGGVQAVFLGDGLDGQLEGHDVVGGAEGVGVFKVDLVLAAGALVVGGFDLKAHLLQRQADFPAGGFPVVEGA